MLVVASQVARVVVGDLLRVLFGERELPVLYELGEELGDVDDLERHLELRVLVLERVVAMGRGDEYLFDARIDEGLDVLLRELLEELLVARLADDFLRSRPLCPLRCRRRRSPSLRTFAVAWATFLSLGS